MSKSTPRHRMARVISLFFSNRSLATRQLCAMLEVSKRTVREDLKLLAEESIIQVVGEGRERRWSLKPSVDLNKLGFVDQIAFQLGHRHLGFLKGTLFGDVFPAASANFGDSVPEKMRKNLDRKLYFIDEPSRDYVEQSDIFDTIIDALFHERQLTIHYKRGESSIEQLTVSPLTLVVYRRSVYLVGGMDGYEEEEEEEEGNDIRRFALDRFEDATIGERFDYPESWDPNEAFGDWFGFYAKGEIGEVVLHFSAERAQLVLARQWHHSATTRVLDDGRVELRMTTGGPELVRFVLEWGDKCQVISPPWLREAVVSEVQATVKMYEGDGQLGGTPQSNLLRSMSCPGCAGNRCLRVAEEDSVSMIECERCEYEGMLSTEYWYTSGLCAGMGNIESLCLHGFSRGGCGVADEAYECDCECCDECEYCEDCDCYVEPDVCYGGVGYY